VFGGFRYINYPSLGPAERSGGLRCLLAVVVKTSTIRSISQTVADELKTVLYTLLEIIINAIHLSPFKRASPMALGEVGGPCLWLRPGSLEPGTRAPGNIVLNVLLHQNLRFVAKR
jgi:hypothetical protein